MDTTMSQRQIDKRAQSLLQAVFGDTENLKFPIDINKLIEYCGLSVKQGKFQIPDLEAALDRKARVIYLEEGDSPENQSFAAAHELGHFKLHDYKTEDVFTMYDLNNILEREHTGGPEAEADRFAASLLMPEKTVRSMWDVTKDVSKLSKIFGVPMVVVRYRLKALGLQN